MKELVKTLLEEESKIRQGGGEAGKQRQKRHGRLTARERLVILLDEGTHLFEVGLWAAYGMYEEWGGLPAAGVVTGIGTVSGRQCMIIANDATVKAGAFFPQSVRKVLRAQRIAYQCRLPILYLVDSSGVFLPLQDEIFPDEDDFGRIFRNNSVLSAQGIPQFAAIMGNCIAGGGYLPVLCDQLLMTRGSGLYLAGPALVKAAIGQVIDTEELGGAEMHASVSGTVDFLEEDDVSCLHRLRELVSYLPTDPLPPIIDERDEGFYNYVSPDNNKTYDVMDLLAHIVDEGSLNEYKSRYGKALVTAYGKIHGQSVGIIANQRKPVKTGRGQIEIGGVIYSDSADKASRFVMDCNQMKIPLVFLQDVVGFMVGREAEQSGIIRSGAKLVNVISNSVVPKITVIIGNSFGAGHYALCGKAYDPNFIFAWPNSKYAVMGAEQAADTLLEVREKISAREGKTLDKKAHEDLRKDILSKYQQQMDIRYGAARGWIDAIIDPAETRQVLANAIRWSLRAPMPEKVAFQTGVLQV